MTKGSKVSQFSYRLHLYVGKVNYPKCRVVSESPFSTAPSEATSGVAELWFIREFFLPKG